ncbi:hypothetical protein BJV82DRAFT_589779 [Fennellomyces sp. T-0311]|nr:hypothetical protein BJV82DRAFT_589779 [Fennellomyces sp. T-0311]
MTAVPELNSFVIDGGRGGGRNGSAVQLITSVYNASGDGSWNRGVPIGSRNPIDSSTAVTGPNNLVYISGGTTNQMFSKVQGAMQFPDRMAIFDVAAQTWSSGVGTVHLLTPESRLHHKAALGKDARTIYYVGGIYPSRTINGGITYIYGNISMTDILTYDTINGTWTTVTTSGLIPAPRMDHSLTLKPSTGELIVYGGTEAGSAMPLGDYFYILNTDTMSWSNRTLGTSPGASPGGPRFGHEAILVGENLFIIFGSTGNSDSNLFVLDIENYSWVNSVPAIDMSQPTGGNNEQEDQKGDGYPGELSAGALAGVVIGSVAGAGIIIALIAFLCIRRRHNTSAARYTTANTSEETITTGEKPHVHDRITAYRDYSSPAGSASSSSQQHRVASNMTGKPDAYDAGDGVYNRVNMVPLKPDIGPA